MTGAEAAVHPTPAWGGYAAVDDVLLGDVHPGSPRTWSLAALRRLGGAACRAIMFPGAPRPQAALLDRDGTIIEDRHYLADPDGVVLLPGAAEGLRGLAELGLRLIIVTNQSGVASGRIAPAALDAIHRRLLDLLEGMGVSIAGIYACPHAPDSGCDCRKPGLGLARQAERELGLDLNRVLVVGDKPADIGLGRGLAAPTFLVTTGEGAITLESERAMADYAVDGLDEVARICGHPAGLAAATSLPPA